MPEGKKAAVPAPKPVREEDLYSAKTHLHQPVQVQERLPFLQQHSWPMPRKARCLRRCGRRSLPGKAV